MSRTDEISISIVIPLYNKEDSIDLTLSSVLEQNCSVPFEIVVVDDGSTDKSAEKVLEIASKHKNIRYVKQENAGPSAARNRGKDASRGEWIMFLDADDRLMPDALQTLYDTATQREDITFSCGNFITVESEEKRYVQFPQIRSTVSKNPLRLFMLNRIFPRHGDFLVNKRKARSFEYDINYRRYEDFENFISFFREKPLIAVTSECVMYYQNKYSSASLAFDPARDFACHMDFSHKSFCEKVILARVLKASLGFYPHLKKQYHREWFYCSVSSAIDFHTRVIRKLKKRFS